MSEVSVCNTWDEKVFLMTQNPPLCSAVVPVQLSGLIKQH